MRKHQIENLVWREMVWQRPFNLEAVWDALTHLSALTPRGAVVLECRGSNGYVTHLLGGDRIHIGRIEQALSAHGDIQFRGVEHRARAPVKISHQLKISHPVLSLNTDIAAAVTRAGLAALTEDKRGVETVIQVVLGRGFAPSPTPADLPDPDASWLNVLLGTVSKASAEERKTARQKAEQHGFEAAIRIGVSNERAISRIRSLLSALKTLESAGVRISDEAANPEHLNIVRIPWHFPLQRISIKELANFLLLPAGEEELPGTPGLHPKLTLPPVWYRSPEGIQNSRSFGISMDMVPKKLSISPKDSLEHTHLIGPTGSGKSTAMLHLILADINANRSVLVLDPKADLVNDVLARIPEERADDVVVIDPSDSSPCGFNPLAFREYGDPALLADSILSVMKEIFSDSWGVRTADILNAALLTLVKVENATLLWLPALLTDEAFRMKIISDTITVLPVGSLRFFMSGMEYAGNRVPVVMDKLFNPDGSTIIWSAQKDGAACMIDLSNLDNSGGTVIFPEPGEYTLTATLRDSNGKTVTASQSITVISRICLYTKSPPFGGLSYISNEHSES